MRGRIPDELNETLAYDIGRAYAPFVKPRARRGRARHPPLEPAARRRAERGLTDSGVDVLDIGLCGTEGVYFATFAERLDGGIMVTASHNPPDYNGMKFVREQSQPISADNGLQDIRALIEERPTAARKAASAGSERPLDIRRQVPRAPAVLRRCARSSSRSRSWSTPATAARA